MQGYVLIEQDVAEKNRDVEQEAEQALIIEELIRLHEGVLARYGLRPSEFELWNVMAH
ncbi:hypothetical protein [Leucothrix pacifica]|uniref:hypothetical protein n=1 Tax=Leucothrix pacifica TaxID=1247513 RepID=UPI0015E83208|nr:hypothetical protein [Leucothrix pacifica]